MLHSALLHKDSEKKDLEEKTEAHAKADNHLLQATTERSYHNCKVQECCRVLAENGITNLMSPVNTTPNSSHDFEECVQDLDQRNMKHSVSVVGPNVNWKFFELLHQEHAEAFGGSQLILMGSCGLYTLRNSFKGGFVVWQLEEVLQALHTVFHNTPARREDFTTLTKSSVFPLAFCGHCWIENLPVMNRAIEIWPQIEMYVDAVTQKKTSKSQNFIL